LTSRRWSAHLMRMQSGVWIAITCARSDQAVAVRYFNRDVECIRTFFRRRFRYESSLYPRFRKTIEGSGEEGFRLDVMVEASGFGRKEMRVLEQVPIIFSFTCFYNFRNSIWKRYKMSNQILMKARRRS
jgi:hypothetical protein